MEKIVFRGFAVLLWIWAVAMPTFLWIGLGVPRDALNWLACLSIHLMSLALVGAGFLLAGMARRA